jgi:hypothetical protein
VVRCKAGSEWRNVHSLTLHSVLCSLASPRTPKSKIERLLALTGICDPLVLSVVHGVVGLHIIGLSLSTQFILTHVV